MLRLFAVIILIFTSLYSYGAMVDLEAGAAERSYGGAAGESIKHSIGFYSAFQQNMLLAYDYGNFQINSGLDFNYHTAETDETKTEFYQFGASGIISFEKYFSGNGYTGFYPYIPVHGGYVRSVIESELKNIENGSFSHIFTGIGAGFAVFMGEFWGTKTSYVFDAHIMKGGIVQSHSLSLGLFFRYDSQRKYLKTKH